MGFRTIHLDNETEKVLNKVTKPPGQLGSTTLTRGNLTSRDQAGRRNQKSVFEIYCDLDLGPGGYAIAPSTDIRRGMLLTLRRRPRR